MPDWSVKIVPRPSGVAGATAAFNPNPLPAQEDDLVSWNNTTTQSHWPWPTDAKGVPLKDSEVSPANGNYLSDEIPAGTSSSPAYDVVMPSTGNTIHYCCKLHPHMRGTITVTAIPAALQVPPP